jgi:hypothetical protein
MSDQPQGLTGGRPQFQVVPATATGCTAHRHLRRSRRRPRSAPTLLPGSASSPGAVLPGSTRLPDPAVPHGTEESRRAGSSAASSSSSSSCSVAARPSSCGGQQCRGGPSQQGHRGRIDRAGEPSASVPATDGGAAASVTGRTGCGRPRQRMDRRRPADVSPGATAAVTGANPLNTSLRRGFVTSRSQ